MNCGAQETALAELLRWPQAMKCLFYDANQVEWSGRLEGQKEPAGWESSAFIRAISSQKESLEKLVITRQPPVHEGLGYSNSLDLSAFTSLWILHVHHVFLNAFVVPFTVENTHTRLLPSLVEFQVLYDDFGYMDFLENEPYWLISVLKNKDQCLPNLEMVHIWTYEKLFPRDAMMYEDN